MGMKGITDTVKFAGLYLNNNISKKISLTSLSTVTMGWCHENLTKRNIQICLGFCT